MQEPSIPTERLIDARELRRRVPISDPTLWRWIAAGIIPPPRRIGGKRYWPESVADALVNGERGAA
jgi:predicted DNA-binding transcriptional regulator AlpA